MGLSRASWEPPKRPRFYQCFYGQPATCLQAPKQALLQGTWQRPLLRLGAIARRFEQLEGGMGRIAMGKKERHSKDRLCCIVRGYGDIET